MGRARGKGAVYSNTYDEETIEKGLTAVALEAGDYRAAERRMNAEGYGVTQTTLRSWATEKHVDRYIEATKRVRSLMDGRAAGWLMESVRSAHELKMKLYAELEEALKEKKIPAKDLSSNIRNLGVDQGIGIQRHGELTGRPIVHEHRRSPEELLRALEREHPTLVVNSEAEEIPAAKEIEAA